MPEDWSVRSTLLSAIEHNALKKPSDMLGSYIKMQRDVPVGIHVGSMCQVGPLSQLAIACNPVSFSQMEIVGEWM